MTDVTQPTAAVFDSRFRIDEEVLLKLAHVELPARVLSTAFLAGKVLYTLAVYTGFIEEDLKNQYGLVNSIGWDEDGTEFIRVPDVDSVFVMPTPDKVPVPILQSVQARLQRVKHAKIETARKAGSGITMNLEVYCSNEETARTVANWLAAAARNCGVGHSATVAAFFDGDGADFIEVKGLPENDGAAMADACGNWGDGLMAHIGPYSAQTYNTSYADVNGESVEVLRRKTVWPPEKAE
jgi:hypothetical protein